MGNRDRSAIISAMLTGMAFIALLLSARPASVTKAQSTKPQSTTTYRVDSGKFTFEYPVSFQDRTAASQAVLAKQRADAQARGEAPSICTDIVFSGHGLTDSAASSLLVIKLDMACLKKRPTDEFLSSFFTNIVKSMKKGPKDEFTDPRLYLLSVHRAMVVRGSIVPNNGRPSSVLKTCAVAEGDVYCWTLTSGSDELVDEMAHLFVTFDGKEPAPLIPPILLKIR
ncbi:MAG TPA: hypothetical protein VIJ79_11580 [Acidobacteriaceae bacterium]